MLFPRSIIVALLGAPLLAFAQIVQNGPNAFTNDAFTATAGQPLTLKWTPSTPGPITLTLRMQTGSGDALTTGTVIKGGIANSGSYTWIPQASIAPGSGYTVEISDDKESSAINFSHVFQVVNTNFVSTSTSQSSSTSSASSTSSPSSSSVSSTSSSSSSTSSSSQTTTTSSSSSSSRSSTSTQNSSQSAQSTAAQSTGSPSHNAAPRATAMAGMLGMVALGALAL